MADTNQPIVSIQEQIIARMIEKLHGQDVFSDEIIQNLFALSRQEKLSKENEVDRVLKVGLGGGNETN